MAIQLGSAYGKVAIDSRGVKTGVDDGIKSLKNLEAAGQAIGGAMQKIGAGLTLGVTVPVVAFFKASIDSAMEAENTLTELNTVIKSTGGAAGVTADEVTRMASELQKVTKFSDDQIVKGQSMLLTFTKIGKDVFPLATEAMLNMGEKFGSVDQAAIQLGKALNDPVAGVGALRRVGVTLSEQQEQQIKDFIAVNDIASAQKIILKELETEFGGLARAAGETTAGKMAQLRNAFDDLRETVGAQLIPLLLPLIKGLTSLVEKFANLPAPVQKFILVLMGLAALVGPIIAVVGTIVSAVSSIAGFIGTLSGLGVSLAGIGTAISALGPILATIGTIITGTLLPAIGALLVELAPIILVIAAIAAAIYLLYAAWQNNFLGIQDIVHGFVEKLKGIWEAFTNIRAGAIKLFEDGSGALLDLATAFGFPKKATQELLAKVFSIISAINNLRAGAIKLFEDGSGALLDLAIAFGFPAKAAQEFLAKIYSIIDQFRNVFTRAREWIVNLFNKADWAQLGRYIVFGIANGMLLGIPTLVLAATKAAESALAAIKTKLGIHSRSKVFEQLGIFSAQGYQYGLAGAMSADAIAGAMLRPVNQLAGSQQQNITMQFASGLSITQVKGMIDANNEQMMNTIIGALGGA